MKPIVEQYNAWRQHNVAASGRTLVPVLGRLSQSPLKRLQRAYRDGEPLALLMSHSRFAPGYVVDRFLDAADPQATVIRVERSLDDATALMEEIIDSVGFESRATSLAHLDHAFGLFLRYQKARGRRTILVIRDIDAHGLQVLVRMRKFAEFEAANRFGLMIILTAPVNGLPEALAASFDEISARALPRIVLTPFSMSETREFVKERFESCAHAGDTITCRFEYDAVALIHELSAGVPETVDLLGNRSVELAVRAGGTTVTTPRVRNAAQLLGLITATTNAGEEPAVPAEELPDSTSERLVVKIHGEPERTIRLNGSHLLIGRDRLCDICVDDVQVSRLHGLFARAADGLHYVDLGSTNGSAVNGEETHQSVLANNDVVAVGDVRIIYFAKRADHDTDAELDMTDTFEIPAEDARPPITYVGRGILEQGKP